MTRVRKRHRYLGGSIRESVCVCVEGVRSGLWEERRRNSWKIQNFLHRKNFTPFLSVLEAQSHTHTHTVMMVELEHTVCVCVC